MRTLHYFFCLPIALVPFLAQDTPDEKPAPPPPNVPQQVLMPIEGIVHQLAKGSREREVKDLLGALEKLGYPKNNLERLEKTSTDELEKSKNPIDSLPSGSKQLRTTSGQLAAIMNTLTDAEQKKEMARNILRIDGENEQAHTALGHVKVNKSWVNESIKHMRERRGEILQHVAMAKKLEIPLVTEENVDDPYIQEACGKKATVVKYGMLEFRTNFSVERTERMLREIQRAYALSYWLRKGDLSPMDSTKKPVPGTTWILIDSREQYEKYTTAMAAAGKLEKSDLDLMAKQDGKIPSFNFADGTNVCLAQWEASTLSQIFVWTVRSFGALIAKDLPTPLAVGHMNWITLSCFGTTLPGYAVKEKTKRSDGDTKVAGDEREREELLRLAKAGIAGSRTWMQYLAERREDPLFGASLVNAMGEIGGNDLHKCTSIADYFHEAAAHDQPGSFQKIYASVIKKADGTPAKRYMAAMGMTFGELENKWRDWLLGARPGVQERIDKENLAMWPKDAIRVLDYMNDIRENAFKGRIKGVWKLKFDADLSGPCDMHANYLLIHPEQRKWPDAHEEYADKEGYSVEGVWAGTHSVIAWGGIADYKEAIDGWMGTFYHRLPLIDPGVLRLGWGQAGEYWVMDMSSLAAPYDEPFVVIWPYDGQKDVPCAFSGNELPDPVPEKGEDGKFVEVIEEDIFGYPITIQTKTIDEKGETVKLSMKLFEEKSEKEVECHFHSPEKPSNPESPSDSWCLIPKKYLKPNTSYKVVAEYHNAASKTTAVARSIEWTFKTE